MSVFKSLKIEDATTDSQKLAVDSNGKIGISSIPTETNSASIKTAVEAIQSTAGIKKITDALPTGSNAIGKLAANSGVDIGDVDVTTMPGTGVEDAAETAGGTLHMIGVVRRDTPASSSGTTGDNSTVNTDANGAIWVDPVGSVAHDGVDANNPIKIGAKAIASPKSITPVAANDRTDLYSDTDGIQLVKLNTSGADLMSESVSNTNGSATASGVFTAVANTYNYITAITVYNSSATAGFIIFTDGNGGATKWTMPLPAGGGAVISSAMPLFKTSANTALYFDVSAALSTVYLSLSGYQSKV